jgi:hypothetical protein
MGQTPFIFVRCSNGRLPPKYFDLAQILPVTFLHCTMRFFNPGGGARVQSRTAAAIAPGKGNVSERGMAWAMF